MGLLLAEMTEVKRQWRRGAWSAMGPTTVQLLSTVYSCSPRYHGGVD